MPVLVMRMVGQPLDCKGGAETGIACHGDPSCMLSIALDRRTEVLESAFENGFSRDSQPMIPL